MIENEVAYYFEEVMHHLAQAGVQVGEMSERFLPVLWNDQSLCEVSREGIMFWADAENSTEMEQIKRKVHSIVNTVSEYMKLMKQAPQIRASGLEGDYRALAEFNNVVLAGHQTRYGMEFVTWEWVQNHTALWQGHYYGDSYAAAKQDFVTRSGLLSQEQLFSDQQFAEMYRCIHETLDGGYPITAEREKLLTESAEQIESAVPDLEELVQKSNEAELAVTEEDDLGMTQRF